jgi:hypothetical protein
VVGQLGQEGCIWSVAAWSPPAAAATAVMTGALCSSRPTWGGYAADVSQRQHQRP